MTSTRNEIDDELRQLAKRRADHLDALTKALIGIDSCDDRTQVLLDRRNEAAR